MKKLTFISLLLVFYVFSCEKDTVDQRGDLEHIVYNPTPYEIPIFQNVEEMEIPDDNPTTMQGVNLGRFLFYDPILSKDSSMTCASCHLPELSFVDPMPVSIGVEGNMGERNAMSLLNVGFFNNGLFWDGRVQTLEEQAIEPVMDPLELHKPWQEIEELLRESDRYPEMFRKAFGIHDSRDIERSHVVMAIAQFERSLVSSGNSKFDRVRRGEVSFTDDELEGAEMFFDEGIAQGLPDAQCFHCHVSPLFTDNQYHNNGLDYAEDLYDFDDLGRGAVTGNPADNGKFRTPSLRNIALTAPYMHDGRFETLEEVVDHYVTGGHFSRNKSPFLDSINLSETQQHQIIAFLHTLTDTTFVNDPSHQNPYPD